MWSVELFTFEMWKLINLAVKISELAFKVHATLLSLLGSKMTINRGTLSLDYAEFFYLFSSFPKPKGKKAKDTKRSVKVPAEPQTMVGGNHVDISSADLAV